MWHVCEREEEWRYGTYGREEKNGDVAHRRERGRMEM
jgi:hypothetical protein